MQLNEATFETSILLQTELNKHELQTLKGSEIARVGDHYTV